MTPDTAQRLVEEAAQWWSTSIIDIEPGSIRVRGYPIQELIGQLTFAQMIWLMLRGEIPSTEQARLLEAVLVAAVDHGPQAPSIAIARMATTCGLAVNGAMASAINALDDVHGGAGQQCMDLLLQIAERAPNLEADIAEEILTAFIAEHGKIVPGFGHRFHPVDPRATRLLVLVEEAQSLGIVSGQFARIGLFIEAALSRRARKHTPMNIDGISAVIFAELGFSAMYGRGLFILSRSVGILAHAIEQRQQGGRIKGPMPKSIPYTYTGPGPRHVRNDSPVVSVSATATR